MKNSLKTTGILSVGLMLAIVVLFTSSCKKNFTGEIEDASTNRYFTPSNLSVSTVKDSAKIKWTAPQYALKGMPYTVELSTDSLFKTVDYKILTDTTSALLIDPQIKLNTLYFTRVKANDYNGRAASSYLYATRTFRLTGQQYLRVIRDFEITTTTVLLHWFINSETSGLTEVVFTPSDGSAPIRTPISAADIIAGQKLVTGLSPNGKYTIQLFAGNKSKGIINVSTPQAVTFTTTISPGANLTTVIAAAADGDIIGLNPGTYNFSSIYQVLNKTITIRSVSNNPADTKILLREIDLIGDGAGINLAGIDINGNYTGTTYSVTPIQLYGTAAVTGAAATFTNIKVDNCIIHDFSRCLVRGNYGTIANDQKIGSITFNNSIIYNIDQTNVQGYYIFSLEKLQVNVLSVTKSTIYNLGEGMVNMSTVLSTTSGVVPTITFDYDTFNNFAGNTKYPFIDALSNKVVFNFTNSIVANTPINGSINTVAFRASNSANVLSFSNNNYFKLNITPGGSAISLTGLIQNNNQRIDLGWTANTTNFFLTPTTSNTPIFSASTNGSTVGDPRWAY